VILKKEMGYYGRLRHRPVKTKPECEGQILIKGHGRLPLERVCFVSRPPQRDLKDIKRELQVSLGYR
jgi:hypothetical protein